MFVGKQLAGDGLVDWFHDQPPTGDFEAEILGTLALALASFFTFSRPFQYENGVWYMCYLTISRLAINLIVLKNASQMSSTCALVHL